MATVNQDKATDKATEKMPEGIRLDTPVPAPSSASESETATFNIQYHRKRCQVSFAADNTVMVITVPMTHTNRTFIRGFMLDMYDVACQWFAQKEQLRQKLSISGQKFNFKQGIQNILRGRK